MAPKRKHEEEDVNRRNLTFSKRKMGLFNKLTELSIMCNAETALLISSPNGKFYACGYPSVDAVVNRYVTGSRPPRGGRMGPFNEKVETLRAGYEARLDELNELRRKLAELTEEQKRNGGGGALSSLWWEAPIDDMDLDSIEQFKKYLEMLKMNFVIRSMTNKNFPPPPVQHPHMQRFAPNHPRVLCPTQPEQYRWQQVQSGSCFEGGESSGLSSGAVVNPLGSSGSISSDDLPPFPPSNFGYDGGAMVNPFGSSASFSSDDLPRFPPSNFHYDGGAMVPFGSSGCISFDDLPQFPPSN